MNPIDSMFRRLASEKKKAFIPFVPAGDPDLATTAALVREAARCGAALIEIGFPYSDPIADGSVIQASYTRALGKGLKIDDIFAMVGELCKQPPFAAGAIPLVGMVSFSLVHRRGPEKFLAQAKKSGLSGLIVPDLPVEESEALARLAAEKDVKLIQLVTPTTPPERAARIVRMSSGFVYCVSVVGITGERSAIPPDLIQKLRWLRTQTDLPLCVGFGISKPEHILMLREHVDGIIVGSALVRILEQAGKKPLSKIIEEFGDQVQTLANV